MGIWDVFAGAGEAVDPARQWLETVYKIKANKAQREQEANDAALKGVLDLGGRSAIREAAYEKTRKAKEGKGFSLDKFPLQNMSEAYRQEERDPANILSAVGAARGAYGQNLTDRAGTEFQLKRPGMLDARSEPAPAEGEDVNRLFRQTAVQPAGQMVGKPRASLADVTLNEPAIGAADITQTLGTKAAQARRIAQPIRDVYGSIPEYATSPEDEALITSRLKAIDSYPDLRPEVKNVLKKSILVQAAKAKAAGRAQTEAQRQTAVGDATTRIYREQYPERTVPALAERAIAGQETAAANKATLEKDLARIREGAQHARLAWDKMQAGERQKVIGEVMGKYDEWDKELDDMIAQNAGNPAEVARLKASQRDLRQQRVMVAASSSPGGTKDLGPLVTGLKPKGKGGAAAEGEKKPDEETKVLERDRAAKLAEASRLAGQGDPSLMAQAQAAEDRANAITDQLAAKGLKLSKSYEYTAVTSKGLEEYNRKAREAGNKIPVTAEEYRKIILNKRMKGGQ